MCPSAWVATKPLWWVLGQHIVLMIAYILRSTCFCEIWALWVSWITYDQLYYALCLVCWELSSSLVPATVYHVPKCMSSHKTIVVKTGRAHCFYDCIYITLILLLWDLSTLGVVDLLWPLIYIYINLKYLKFETC